MELGRAPAAAVRWKHVFGRLRHFNVLRKALDAVEAHICGDLLGVEDALERALLAFDQGELLVHACHGVFENLFVLAEAAVETVGQLLEGLLHLIDLDEVGKVVGGPELREQLNLVVPLALGIVQLLRLLDQVLLHGGNRLAVFTLIR